MDIAEVLKIFIKPEVALPAVITVIFVEGFNRYTSEDITKKKYAFFVTIGMCVIISWVWSLIQPEISHQQGLWRGLLSAALATFGYNFIKAALENFNFGNRRPDG